MDDLYNIITQCTDKNVIWANENGRRPALPFFTLDYKTTAGHPVHFGSIVDAGSNYQRSVAAHRDLIVELTAHGVNAYFRLDEIAQKLQSTAISDYCVTHDVAIVSINSIKDIPELIDDAYEQRAQLEFTYRYVASIDEDIGVIEEVRGDINTQTGTETSTNSFISTVDLEVKNG